MHAAVHHNQMVNLMKPSPHGIIAPAIVVLLPSGRQRVAVLAFDRWLTFPDGQPAPPQLGEAFGGILGSSSLARVYNAVRGRAVVAFTDDDDEVERYVSIADAARAGYSASCIRACLNGERLTHRGKRWAEVGHG